MWYRYTPISGLPRIVAQWLIILVNDYKDSLMPRVDHNFAFVTR